MIALVGYGQQDKTLGRKEKIKFDHIPYKWVTESSLILEMALYSALESDIVHGLLLVGVLCMTLSLEQTIEYWNWITNAEVVNDFLPGKLITDQIP